MTAHATPQVMSRLFRERPTVSSTAPMPDARPWRRGQAPKPRSGAPEAQGLTAAVAVEAPSSGTSIAPDDPINLSRTGADAVMNPFATSGNYTTLTGTTPPTKSPFSDRSSRAVHFSDTAC